MVWHEMYDSYLCIVSKSDNEYSKYLADPIDWKNKSLQKIGK